jgi:hypothetical protein
LLLQAARLLEEAALHFFASFGWLFTYRIGLP